MGRININSRYPAVFSNASDSSRVLEETELDYLRKSGLDEHNYVSVTDSSISVDIDFSPFSPYVDTLEIVCPTHANESNVAFYKSTDGSSFTQSTPVVSSYKITGTKTSSSGSINSSNHSDSFCPVNRKLYRIISGSSTLYIYNVDTNAWSTASLGFTPQDGLVISASTKNTYAYIIPGNGTSNFYELNLTTNAITAKTPTPITIAHDATVSVNLEYCSSVNRLYFTKSNTTTMYMYDIITDSWTTIGSVPLQIHHCIVYVSDLNSLLFFPGYNSSTNVTAVYIMSLPGNVWRTLYSEYTLYSIWNSADLVNFKAVYSEIHKLIFIHATPASGNVRVLCVDPFLDKFLNYKTAVYDTAYNAGGVNLAYSRSINYDSVTGNLYLSTIGNNNLYVYMPEFSTLFTYYAAISSTVKKLRVVASSGSIHGIRAIGNNSNVDAGQAVTYNYTRLGTVGQAVGFSIANSGTGTASGIVSFIEADGSEGSRNAEISIDGDNWISHCVYNSLSSFSCSAYNSNYDTTNCGLYCTLSNGGVSATAGFSPATVSGSDIIPVSGSYTVYCRSRIPTGKPNIDKTFTIGSELLF